MRAGLEVALATRGAPPAPPNRTAVEAPTGAPADFICEDDVRRALRDSRRLLVGPRTILTPAARDLGTESEALVWLDGTRR
jgi:hypothetical protein